MASFKRKCSACSGIGEVYSEALDKAVSCVECGGSGYHEKPIRIAGVSIRIDNRQGKEFVITIHPDGLIELRQRKHKAKLSTSVQRVFDIARKDAAYAKLSESKAKRKLRKASRGLLRTGGSK